MSTVILSCTTLLKYVQQAQKTCNTDFPIIELNRQYHIEPSKMKNHILQTLSSLSSDVDTILVAMGFCGGSWQDVSCSKTLVLLKEYNKEIADIVFNMYFEHYHHLDIIDNGLYACYDLDYVKRAQADADRIHAELDFVPGSNILLEKLVSGK